jgi:hypothetical protein
MHMVNAHAYGSSLLAETLDISKLGQHAWVGCVNPCLLTSPENGLNDKSDSAIGSTKIYTKTAINPEIG